MKNVLPSALALTLVSTLVPSLFGLPGAVAAAGPPTPSLTFHAITFKPAGGEPVAAEAGVLTVPENRHGGSGKMIELHLVRFPATARPAGPPIVYLAGGPGGSGIAAARGSRFPLFMALRAFGDVIALDQRGTGESRPSTDCDAPFMLPLDEPLDPRAGGAALAAGMGRCFTELRGLGIEPADFDTLENADDLDDLRRALGVDKIRLWGISYGTHLALATLRAHGAHVASAILAGLEPLGHTLKLPADQQAEIAEVSRLAAADPTVGAAVPNLAATLDELLGELADHPRSVTLVHPITGKPVAVTVGAFDLQVVVAGMLRGPESFADLPDLLTRLAGGDWTALALRAAPIRLGSLPGAMSVAMDCASGADASWRRRIALEAPGTLLGDAINFPFPQICQGLEVPQLGDDFRRPVRSEVPVLLISGSLDGRTPPANFAEELPLLPNAREVRVVGAGHGDDLFLASPKILEVMESFLRGEDASATIVLDPPRFVAPRKVVTLPDEVLARYVGTYRIAPGDVRRVLEAGALLFTRRNDGPPLPLRPTSSTDFFWEGPPGSVHFEVSPEGEVLAMDADLDGTGRHLQRAAKVE
jgi:pimeloyl-ACP methyl ester carboxylesterase